MKTGHNVSSVLQLRPSPTILSPPAHPLGVSPQHPVQDTPRSEPWTDRLLIPVSYLLCDR